MKLSKKITIKILGKCDICKKPNTPGHTCRMKFSATNARNLRKRMTEMGYPDEES